MITTVWGTVHNGKVDLPEDMHVEEGIKVLVTVLPSDHEFWKAASQSALDAVWNNPQDDGYAQLLKE